MQIAWATARVQHVAAVPVAFIAVAVVAVAASSFALRSPANKERIEFLLVFDDAHKTTRRRPR